jgi:hypothetical protein
MTFPPEKENVTRALAERGVTLPCPRCGDNGWSVLEAYISNSLTQNASKVIVGGSALPTVAVICTKCGFLSEHVATVLELFGPFRQSPASGKELERQWR